MARPLKDLWALGEEIRVTYPTDFCSRAMTSTFSREDRAGAKRTMTNHYPTKTGTRSYIVPLAGAISARA